MYKRQDKKVSVTLTPYLYTNMMYTGEDGLIVYVEKGRENPDPNGWLYWGWGLDENGEVNIIEGDYKRYYEKLGAPVTFTVTIPGEATYTAYSERAYIGNAIRRKVGQLIDTQNIVMLRKTKLRRKRGKTTRKRTIEELYTSPSYSRTVNETTLRDIADVAGLGSHTKKRFVAFGRLFWEGKVADPTYMLEWARRFGRGSEYDVADDVRLGYLVEVDGIETAKNRILSAYGGGGKPIPKYASDIIIKMLKGHPVERRTVLRKKVVQKKKKTTRRPKR